MGGIEDKVVDVEELLVCVIFEDGHGSFSSYKQVVRVNLSVITFMGNILRIINRKYIFQDYFIYLQTSEEFNHWERIIRDKGALPR
jgi:hypothetical protein